MASPFSETLESRRVDRFKMWRVALIVALVLCMVWGYWFFGASFATYETSRDVRVTGKETLTQYVVQRGGAYFVREKRLRTVVADFPLDASSQIKSGQPARLYLDGPRGRLAGAIPATVVRVTRPDRQQNAVPQKVQVFLNAELSVSQPDPFEEGAGGVVHVEIDRHTPADIVLGASGLQRDTPPVSYRP